MKVHTIRRRIMVVGLVVVMTAATLVSGALGPAFTAGTAWLETAWASPAEEEVVLVNANDPWKFSDNDTNQFGEITADFRAKCFDDSIWKSGPAPLGYPATDASLLFGAIGNGGTLVANRAKPDALITYYFRRHFTAENLAEITKLTAQIAVDDGYVLYLNGHEISRLNMPAGEVNHSTIAADTWEPSEERANVTVDLTAFRQYLTAGDNVLAADVHNRDNNSSDIYFGMTLKASYLESGQPLAEPEKTPAQLNVHVGDDARTGANFTWTTVAEQMTTATLKENKEGAQSITVTGESSVGASNKYFHKISVTGLKENTEYVYTAGVAPNTIQGKFKTAPDRNTDDTVRFIYLADTQVSNAANAEALGATLEESAKMNPDFVYLAGDITDTATSESQWEQMFLNDGAWPTGGANLFSNYLIAAIQGNHDNNTFNRHINAPAQEGNIVYTFDYGPVTFIMLNLEAARSDAVARGKQKAFLEQAVAQAKSEGRWTAVGFHKSLVTGASHIMDSDVIDARKYWCPVFASLDVDFVLQGHDHVYSRGFVTADGANAGVEPDAAGAVKDPKNAPLYMVGGHAGGLKWYSRINYNVGAGDPITPGYAFLDVNSADPSTDPFGKGQGTDIRKEQVIVEIKANKQQVDINTWMFKYDPETDQITTPKYLFDSLTVQKNQRQTPETTSEIQGPETAVVEHGNALTYTVSYDELVKASAFDTAIEYDKDVLRLEEVKGLPDSIFTDVEKDLPGKARLIQGVANAVTSKDAVPVAQFVFRIKDGAVADETSVKLTRADTVGEDQISGKITDIQAIVTKGEAVTRLKSEKKVCDVNKDGKISLADLAEAMVHYQETGDANPYDVNGDGVVDAADLIIISRYIRTA